MGWLLIGIGGAWLLYKILQEVSWNTRAYDGKDLDIDKMFYDTNVKMTTGKMSKSEFKRKYKRGDYAKKD